MLLFFLFFFFISVLFTVLLLLLFFFLLNIKFELLKQNSVKLYISFTNKLLYISTTML